MQYWGDVHYTADTGRLSLGDVDAVAVASAYGTPLLTLSEAVIRRQCRRFHHAFQAAGIQDYTVAYAGKAFITIAICQLMAEENMSLDVVSGGELYTALAADFPAGKIIFHGNNKTIEELNQALDAGVGCIVVDNFTELDRLSLLAADRNQQVNVLLRVAPGVEAETHTYVDTGRQDTKFGFDIVSGQALEAVRRALDRPALNLLGLHCHIGSQIFKLDPYKLAIRRIYEFMDDVYRNCGVIFTRLDLGGGLGVKYLPDDQPPSVEQWIETLVTEVRQQATSRGWPVPGLIVEPGRSIIAEAGVTLYRVGSIKRVPEVGTYVAVDGGMMENLRPALYNARYTGLLIPGPGNTPLQYRPFETVAVVGRACESGDVLIPKITLPQPETGDYLAMLTTGAYTYSMASNYNKFPRPAVVLLDAGKARVVVEREKYHDLIRLERPLRQQPRVASSPTKVARWADQIGWNKD